ASLQTAARLDFIDICTPPASHAELIAEACRSGLHVFSEKPLVTGRSGLEQVDEAAKTSGKVVFAVNNWKYTPLWNQVLALVKQGVIGTVRSVSLEVLRTPSSGGGASDWRRRVAISGGGILLDHGWHALYLVRALVSGPPLTVSARMGFAAADPALEDEVDLSVGFGEAEARIFLTWRSACRKNLATICGEEGRIAIHDDHFLLEKDHEPSRRIEFPEPLSAGSHHLDWMIPVGKGFHRELCDPRVRGENFMEARWCARLIDQAYQSHRRGSRSLSAIEG
ncbi:MAG TPA: Gfo/Idh/MocA family oxidoreductase, partial [Desulfuromonadales bacterium]|nr:Gfo/Idh/MocA family oxidoreductase [Desulfuromonadales bacterium]